MKKRMTRILTLFLSASMAVTPIMSVQAEEMNPEQQVEADAGEQQESAEDETQQGTEQSTGDLTTGDQQQGNTPDAGDNNAPEGNDVNQGTSSEDQNIDLDGAAVVGNNDNQIMPMSIVVDDKTYEDGAYDFAIESSYAMFTVLDPKATVSGDKLIVSFHNQNTTYDRIYLGDKEEIIDNVVRDESKIVQGTLNDGGSYYNFQFEVPVSKMGTTIKFAPCKKEDGVWYVKKDCTFTIPKVLEEPALTYEEGNYTLAITSGFAMFKINADTQKAVVSDGKITVSFETTSNTYDRFYFGSKDDDKTKVTVIQGTKLADKDGYLFTFTLPTSKMGQTVPFVPGKPDGSWYSNKQYTLTIPASLTADTATDPEPDPDPSSTVPAEGEYKTEVESSSGMFKVIDCVLTSKDGKMTALITLSGTSYDYLYMGSTADAATAAQSELIPFVKDADGKYTYTILVSALDTPISIAAHSSKSGSWFERTLTFKSESLDRILADGKYKTNVESSSTMFKVVNCVLSSQNGEKTAVITLSGVGYDYLYLGTAAEAGTAAKSELIPFVKDADGKYTYTLPVSALDTPISVAAHSISKDQWYDRTLTFLSEGMELVGTVDSGNSGNNTNNGNQNNETKPDTTPDSESKYESDTNGSTGKVDNSTTLPDGVYTPDRFSWSGGSGKVNITCNKITVSGGQAYATLVFSSDAYVYVKANGNIYYGTKGGGTSTFVIPVELNKNNQIIGMTTKMSTAHEITYSIFVYLAAADGNGSVAGALSNEKLSEEAPEIMGLVYESETEVKYAELFKIFNYEDGITLLEVDTTRYTALDPENQENADEKKETEEKEADETVEEAEETSSEEETTSQTTEEAAAELYKGNIVRYLLVPEGTVIPAGLDKEMIVVELPVQNAYVASAGSLEKMKDMDILDVISAVGVEADDCEIAELVEAMKEEKVLFAGDYKNPDYKTLVKAKSDLAILPGALLPLTEQESEEELTEEEQKERIEEITERMATLGIPVIIDRSADEKEDLAKAEWIKVYGILFGKQDAAEKLFEVIEQKADTTKAEN